VETLIVQLDALHGRLNEFIKVEKENFSLGRALSNDLVLSDPYLSPQQLRFFGKTQGMLFQQPPSLFPTNRFIALFF